MKEAVLTAVQAYGLTLAISFLVAVVIKAVSHGLHKLHNNGKTK